LKDFQGEPLYYKASIVNTVFLIANIYQNLQKENFGRAVLHTLVNAISTTALVDVVTSGIKLLANTSLLGEVGSYVVGFMASHPIIFAVGRQ